MIGKSKEEKKPRTPARFATGAQVRIEPDSGEAPVIEQPTSIVTRPLNEKEQDDRVRIALVLTSADPLPAVDEGTLLSYHRYLAAHWT